MYNPMNMDLIQTIRDGQSIMFGMGRANSIKYSPRECDSWRCEHQYGINYTYSHENNHHLFFTIRHPLTGDTVATEWYIDTTTFSLLVPIRYDASYRWETYTVDEYSVMVGS